MLNFPTLPAVNSMSDMQRTVEELRTFFAQLQTVLGGLNQVPTSGHNVLLLDPNGNVTAYQFLAGTGITITANDALRKWTISSP